MVIYAVAQTRKYTTETGSNVSSTTFSSMIHFAPVVPVTTTANNCDHHNRHTSHFTPTCLFTYNDTRRWSTKLHESTHLPPELQRVCTHWRKTKPPMLPRVNTHRQSTMLRENTNWPPMLQNVGTAAKPLSSTALNLQLATKQSVMWSQQSTAASTSDIRGCTPAQPSNRARLQQEAGCPRCTHSQCTS